MEFEMRKTYLLCSDGVKLPWRDEFEDFHTLTRLRAIETDNPEIDLTIYGIDSTTLMSIVYPDKIRKAIDLLDPKKHTTANIIRTIVEKDVVEPRLLNFIYMTNKYIHTKNILKELIKLDSIIKLVDGKGRKLIPLTEKGLLSNPRALTKCVELPSRDMHRFTERCCETSKFKYISVHSIDVSFRTVYSVHLRKRLHERYLSECRHFRIMQILDEKKKRSRFILDLLT
jgi:hypothetical protein